ncbi:hypothetical protein BU23DRAFT_570111 [Bimuria novae-zelandiae CBS 107.79]|uniref:Uncharacterized protein n=1 Tax=Bimuria novae-zelandiae CBS 107.79 TaxID=1447943 RepID=A0A6A5V1X8_9PLEO|nr:hypothetical protein BU23DRAFT_570111 [Bimuria novae-zelandiae CBS 107.79]
MDSPGLSGRDVTAKSRMLRMYLRMFLSCVSSFIGSRNAWVTFFMQYCIDDPSAGLISGQWTNRMAVRKGKWSLPESRTFANAHSSSSISASLTSAGSTACEEIEAVCIEARFGVDFGGRGPRGRRVSRLGWGGHRKQRGGVRRRLRELPAPQVLASESELRRTRRLRAREKSAEGAGGNGRETGVRSRRRF